MPSYNRRNNYSSQAGIRPFTGAGRVLGRRPGTGLYSRMANLAAAAGAVAMPAVAGAGRQYLKRKASQISSMRTGMSTASGIKQGRVINEGTGGQCSYFRGPRGKSYLPKHVEEALPPQKVQTSAATQLKSAVGLQNVTSSLTMLPPSLATNYTSDKITRVLYKSSHGSVTLNNIFLSNCYVIIYDCIARKDVSVSAVQNPHLAWIQGDTDESAATAYTLLGSTPFQSEAFNQYWKVHQMTKVVLAAGGTHVHSIDLRPERIVSSAYSTYTPYAFKDVTYYCMLEIHGSPANDTVTQTQVGVGQAGINIVVDREDDLRQLQKSTPTITTNNALISAFTTAEQVVNLGGSTIVPNAEG